MTYRLTGEVQARRTDERLILAFASREGQKNGESVAVPIESVIYVTDFGDLVSVETLSRLWHFRKYGIKEASWLDHTSGLSYDRESDGLWIGIGETDEPRASEPILDDVVFFVTESAIAKVEIPLSGRLLYP